MAIENDFFMLAPLGVSNSELIVGPPDAESQVYAGGTTYAEGDEVWDAGKVYRSKQNSNTGNAVSNATWWEDLGEVDEGALEYASGTTYNIDDYAVYDGHLWQCAADGTSGITPSVTAPQWTQVGRTNRYKAFDDFLQDEASLSGGLTYQLTFTAQANQIVLLRPTGSEARVVMTDAIDGVVYDETQSLLDDSEIVDWHAYFFAENVQQDSVIFDDIPPYTGTDIEITVDGDSAAVAQIVCGAGVAIGQVVTGTTVGIESYSIKDRDDFNRSVVVARPYSDTVDFDLMIQTQRVGYVKRKLAERDALPTLYFMQNGSAYGAVAFGFYQNISIFHSTSMVADCVLEIEGLG